MKAEYFDWLTGNDTGVSSTTLMCVLNGRPAPRFGFDVPHDMADVGRCVRMLALFPELEARLSEVGEQLPAWIPFVDCWPELKRLHAEVSAWWQMSDKERKAFIRKRKYDKAQYAYEYVQRLMCASRYLSGMRPQGGLGSWRRDPTPKAA